jgi:cell division protein ZapA
MKQLEVQIMGQSYLLGCPEGGESRLLEAVERVDSAMCKIRDNGKIKARDRIAVLASLNLAFDLAQRDQQTLTQAATAPLSSTSSPSIAATASAGLSDDATPAHYAMLTALVQRLDAALGEDGQLI